MAINISPFPINNPGLFMIQIQTTGSDETFTLPLQAAGNYNFIVNWGDGSSEDTITAYNDPDRIHTYSVAGTYIISMKGICTYFCFGTEGIDVTKVKKILDFVDMGFIVMNFRGCSNLTFVASSMKKLTHLGSVAKLFEGCSSLTSIPSGIFDGSTGITIFAAAFNGCENLTSIPTDLFRYNTLVDDFSQIFRYCVKITAIPTDLFKNNTVVTNFIQTFMGCSLLIGNAPTLWLRDPEPTNHSNCFYNCTNLDNYASIPNDWKGL